MKSPVRSRSGSRARRGRSGWAFGGGELVGAAGAGSSSRTRPRRSVTLNVSPGFSVVFHTRLAEEVGEFAMRDLLQRLMTKMVSRHPHVFGDASVATPKEALAQWEAIKQREAALTGHPRSAIDGVPRSLPSLLRAQRVQTKAARVHFDWPDARSAWVKVEEEIREAAADRKSTRLNSSHGYISYAVFCLKKKKKKAKQIGQQE